MEKKFLTEDTCPLASYAYQQILTEGLIGDMTLEEFRMNTDHKMVYIPDALEDQYIRESQYSKLQIANLFRSREKRQEVIKKWFGEN